MSSSRKSNDSRKSNESRGREKFIWRSAITPPLQPIGRNAQSAPVVTRNFRYLTTNATVVTQPVNNTKDPVTIFDQYVDQIHRRLVESKPRKPQMPTEEQVQNISESTETEPQTACDATLLPTKNVETEQLEPEEAQLEEPEVIQIEEVLVEPSVPELVDCEPAATTDNLADPPTELSENLVEPEPMELRMSYFDQLLLKQFRRRWDKRVQKCGQTEDFDRPTEPIPISSELSPEANRKGTGDEIDNIDVVMAMTIESAPESTAKELKEVPGLPQDSFDSQDLPTVTLPSPEENEVVETVLQGNRAGTPRPPILDFTENEIVLLKSKLERSETGQSSRLSAKSVRTVVENPDYIQKDEGTDALMSTLELGGSVEEIPTQLEEIPTEPIADPVEEVPVEEETVTKAPSRPPSSKSGKSRKSSGKSARNSARSVKSVAKEPTEEKLFNEVLELEESPEIVALNGEFIDEPITPQPPEIDSFRAGTDKALLELIDGQNPQVVRPASVKSAVSTRSKRSVKAFSEKGQTEVMSSLDVGERKSRQGSAPVVLPSQLSQEKVAEEFCWACKLDVEGDDEWKLLNEELHEQRPHYLIHTCGIEDRKVLSPIDKDLKEMTVPLDTLIAADKSVASGPEDDYRKVDEWAILQEEIHDPEHFAVPETVVTPHSSRSKKSSPQSMPRQATPAPLAAPVEMASLTPMSTLDDVIAAAKRKSVCSSASSPLPQLPQPTNEGFKGDQIDEDDNLDDNSLTDELECTRTATVERLQSARSHNKIEPIATDSIAKKLTDSDDEDFHLTGVPPKNLSLEDDDVIPQKEEPVKRLERIESARSAQSGTKDSNSGTTGSAEKVETSKEETAVEDENTKTVLDTAEVQPTPTDETSTEPIENINDVQLETDAPKNEESEQPVEVTNVEEVREAEIVAERSENVPVQLEKPETVEVEVEKQIEDPIVPSTTTESEDQTERVDEPLNEAKNEPPTFQGIEAEETNEANEETIEAEEVQPAADKGVLQKLLSFVSSTDGYDTSANPIFGMGTSFNSLSPEPMKVKVGELSHNPFMGSLDEGHTDTEGVEDKKAEEIQPEVPPSDLSEIEKPEEKPDVPVKNMRNSVIRPPSKRIA